MVSDWTIHPENQDNTGMDRFLEMRAFVAVIDAGSFVRAADALDLSKTAVSRLVSDLEARLGTRLLHRTTRRLSLTPEGEVFLERCRSLLEGVESAEAELSTHAGEAVGQLRVNVPVTFGLLHLAPLWPAFMALHPRVMLDITLSDRLVDLVDEGYDLAVRIAQLQTSSLVSRQLTSTRLVLCASPDYLRRHGTPAQPSDIAQHSVISYTLLATGDQWAFQGPQGPVSVKVSPRMRTNSGDTCCAAALQHQGIVLQPTFLVGPHLASGALVEILPAYRSLDLGVHAIYPTRKHLTPKVRALIDFLVDAFRMRAWPT
jgi:DNA-binding transcriptional LysR family regulator